MKRYDYDGALALLEQIAAAERTVATDGATRVS
jgi:hypothetical protein